MTCHLLNLLEGNARRGLTFVGFNSTFSFAAFPLDGLGVDVVVSTDPSVVSRDMALYVSLRSDQGKMGASPFGRWSSGKRAA